MINYTQGYTNVGGIPLGDPISSPFDPTKHLESTSFDRAFGKDNKWLGILNLLQNYNKISMPFISATELSKNVLETEGAGSTFTFGIPFLKGCPYIVENLCADNSKPGYGNQPFFILLSENIFTYGDVLTTDLRNGKQLRIQTIEEKGDDAKITNYLNAWKYMVALDSYSEEDYYPAELLQAGTPYMKLFSHNGGEFDNIMSSYSGMDKDYRESLQLYQYTVGMSKQAITTWVTADATYRTFKVENASHPMLNHLSGASSDVLNYWTPKGDKASSVFWIPSFIQKLAGELAKMKENFLLWNQGKSFTTNRGIKVVTGLGFYQQIKQRGNWDTYTDFRQLFNMVLNFSEKLFTVHNMVSPKDRVVKLRAGKIAYAELRKQFSAYFKTDNPFTVFADHPALQKADLISYSDKTGLIYKPLQFNGIMFPEQGLLLVEHDESLDRIDDYLEFNQYTGYTGNSGGMVFIEDITSGNFTNAIPDSLKNGGMSYKNVTMIKTKGYVDKIEYKIGSDCSENLLRMLGIKGDPNVVSTWNKGVEIRLSTEGELWVQDPSRIWMLEYDPEGILKGRFDQHSTIMI